MIDCVHLLAVLTAWDWVLPLLLVRSVEEGIRAGALMIPWVPDGRYPSLGSLPESVRPAYEGNGISVYPEYLDDAFFKLLNFLRSARIFTPDEVAAEKRGERLGVLTPYADVEQRLAPHPSFQHDAVVLHIGSVGGRVANQLADALRGFGCRVHADGEGSPSREVVAHSKCVLFVLSPEAADALKRLKLASGGAHENQDGDERDAADDEKSVAAEAMRVVSLLEHAATHARSTRTIVVGCEGMALSPRDVPAGLAPVFAGETCSLYNEYAEGCYQHILESLQAEVTSAELADDTAANLAQLSTSHGDLRVAHAAHVVAAELQQLRARVAELDAQVPLRPRPGIVPKLLPRPIDGLAAADETDAVSALCAVM